VIFLFIWNSFLGFSSLPPRPLSTLVTIGRSIDSRLSNSLLLPQPQQFQIPKEITLLPLVPPGCCGMHKADRRGSSGWTMRLGAILLTSINDFDVRSTTKCAIASSPRRYISSILDSPLSENQAEPVRPRSNVTGIWYCECCCICISLAVIGCMHQAPSD
jgi:hypothetical protein